MESIEVKVRYQIAPQYAQAARAAGLDVSGQHQEITVPGELVAPGLAVANLEPYDPEHHWVVVQTGTGLVMIVEDLCRGCAYAAAAVMAQHPGWDRPEAEITRDDAAYRACERAHRFGPCYPPPGAAERYGMPMRIAGHRPGEIYQQPAGLPDGMGMLVPAHITDEEVAKATPEVVEAIRLAKEADADTRPWYERI